MFLGWPNSWSCRELLRTLLPRAEARFNPIATEIIISKEIEGPPPLVLVLFVHPLAPRLFQWNYSEVEYGQRG